MPVTHMDAKKRTRQNVKRAARNTAVKSSLKTAGKKVLAAIASGDKAKAEEAFRDASGAYDKAAMKGVIHGNAASRKKSRLATALTRIGAAPAVKGGKGAAKKAAAKAAKD